MFNLRCEHMMSWLAVALMAQVMAFAQTSEDFFDSSSVNDIHMDMHPLDWASLRAHAESNQYYACNIRWLDKTIEQAQVRSRGGGSRSGIKPGFRVDIDQSRPGHNFLGLKSFILDNGAQDASLMKEALTMRLFQKMNLPAPREAHARLFINGEYFGLYILVEEVDEVFLERHFGESTGYLYEYQWIRQYQFEYLGADPKLYSPMMFQPETHKADPEPRPIEAMIRAMDPELTPDPIFAASIPSYIDVRALLRYLAVESYMAEWDGLLGTSGINNFYLYRARNGISRFIPWDKDMAFGGLIANAEDRIHYPILQNVEQNVLIRRALAVAEWRAVYLEALGECEEYAGETDGWLEKEIIRIRDLIQPAAFEDPRKVCPGAQGSLHLCSNEEFQAEAAFLLEFALRRAGWVRQSLEAAWDLHNGAPRP